jgi:hypothetical protein
MSDLPGTARALVTCGRSLLAQKSYGSERLATSGIAHTEEARHADGD